MGGDADGEGEMHIKRNRNTHALQMPKRRPRSRHWSSMEGKGSEEISLLRGEAAGERGGPERLKGDVERGDEREREEDTREDDDDDGGDEYSE